MSWNTNYNPFKRPVSHTESRCPSIRTIKMTLTAPARIYFCSTFQFVGHQTSEGGKDLTLLTPFNSLTSEMSFCINSDSTKNINWHRLESTIKMMCQDYSRYWRPTFCYTDRKPSHNKDLHGESSSREEPATVYILHQPAGSPTQKRMRNFYPHTTPTKQSRSYTEELAWEKESSGSTMHY